MLIGIVWALATAATVLAFVYSTYPYLWIDFAVFAAIVVTAIRLKRTWAKTLCACLAAVVFAIWGLEMYQSNKSRSNPGNTNSATVGLSGQPVEKHQPHDIFGYALVPGLSGTKTKRRGDDIIFIERFTVDDKGLRISPPDRGGSDIECILFFGGSFTYGVGLTDDETLPYQVGIMSGGEYRVHNFAAGGYGPHQMLAALETGFVDDVTDCVPKYIIYQSIDSHLWRASGHAFWDKRGPRYALVSDTVELRGNFDDPLEFSFERHDIFRMIDRSVLYGKVFGGRIREREFDLFVPLVEKTAPARRGKVRR